MTPPPLPDWSLLASWVAVVESGSVSEAAKSMQISQAAVSQRIQMLEKTVGASLLDRSTRPAKPTAAGQRLFEHAKDLLTRAAQMIEGVRSVSRAKRMIVRFGCVDSFASTIGPLLIKGLAQSTHQIRLWSGITPALEELIASRQLDLAVTTSRTAVAGLSRVELFTEDFYLVLPADFEAAALGSLFDIGRRLPFIRYSARSQIGAQVDAYLHQTGDALERSFEFDATDPLLSLVAAGAGFALTTPLCIWQSRQFAAHIRIVPLSVLRRVDGPYPSLGRSFYLACREGELGNLPGEVRDLVRVAVEGQLSREITQALGLKADALTVARDQQRR